MNVDEKETSEVTGSSAAAVAPDTPAWETPGYTVVETSLEVTAYRLADR